MISNEWLQFLNSGSVKDYLEYIKNKEEVEDEHFHKRTDS